MPVAQRRQAPHGSDELVRTLVGTYPICYIRSMDAVLQALADQSRRTVLEILRSRPASAGELAEAIPIAVPACLGTCGRCRKPGWSRYVRKRSGGSTALHPAALVEMDSGWGTATRCGRAGSTPCRPRSLKGRGRTCTITGTMRALDQTRGAVRVKDVNVADIDDLGRHARVRSRWPAGSPRFPANCARRPIQQSHRRVDRAGTRRGVRCPHHLLLTMEPGTADGSEMEAWLTVEGSGTGLVVEERGLPIGSMYFHGAGWPVHLEDLGRSLAGDTEAHVERWTEQTPAPAWRGAGTSGPESAAMATG